MAQPQIVLFVRFKSSLPFDKMMAIVEERAPQFEALTGLQQKYYLSDEQAGEVAGLYLWDSAESLHAFNESELRKSIAATYQAIGEPRVEVYRVEKLLRA